MRQRCNNPRHPDYDRYGGRGIKVCPRWDDFNLFVEDMGTKSSPALTIERIDNAGHYEPGNCEWATQAKQANNRSSNREVTSGGRTMTIANWSRETGVAPDRIARRLNAGWSPERAVASRRPRQVTINGVTRGLYEWARHHGVHKGAVDNRLAAGWDHVRAVTEPVRRVSKPLPPKKSGGSR